MSKIQAIAIVLDQGNTLIMDPFEKVLARKTKAFESLVHRYGITLDIHKLVEGWRRANREVHYPHIGHFLQEEPIIQEALRSLGVVPEVAGFLGLELLREYRDGVREEIDSDPRTGEVEEVLKRLHKRGKRLGVFSNDRILNLGLVLRCMGIQPYFEYIETSESIGFEKPDLRVFEHILNWFQLPSELVAYVGDDPVRDIDGAKRKNLKTVLYSVDRDLYNEGWRNYDAPVQYGPDGIVREFAELLEVFE